MPTAEAMFEGGNSSSRKGPVETRTANAVADLVNGAMDRLSNAIDLAHVPRRCGG